MGFVGFLGFGVWGFEGCAQWGLVRNKGIYYIRIT